MDLRFRFAGRRLCFWGGLALLVWSAYELYIRVDAMLAPLGMLVNMAVGEGIALGRVLSYVDWAIFGVPLYLLLCALTGLLALLLRKRRRAAFVMVPLAAALCAHGAYTTSLFAFAALRVLKALPFAAIGAGYVAQWIVPRRRAAEETLPPALEDDKFPPARPARPARPAELPAAPRRRRAG